MKNFMQIICILAAINFTSADLYLKENVKKRNTIIKINNDLIPTCYNTTIFKNVKHLRRIVNASEFIFTGKISNVQRKNNGEENRKGSVFKVYVRRILKDDNGVFSDLLSTNTCKNSSKSVSLFAEGGPWRKMCSVSKGWSAILFGERLSPIKLLIDPIPLNLDRMRGLKAAIKGNFIYIDLLP